ncbi:MAG: ComEC/Rec2 family competence protein [Alistipes sp.]|nr:ComEC/Rec2 family competence protein [Alistipes sp.]
MEFSTRNIYDRLVKMPMAMVVAPFAVGIFVADKVDIPLWALLVVEAVMLLGVLFARGWRQALFSICMLTMVGALLHTLSFKMEPHYNVPYDMELEVERRTRHYEDYSATEVRIASCEFSPLEGRRLTMWGGAEHNFSTGDCLRLKAPIKPFRESRRSYAEQMRHRDFVGSVSLYPNSVYEFRAAKRKTLHESVADRLANLMAPSEERAVVMAMAVGNISEITPSLRKQYSLSGASHLLAVSGLHVCMVFVLINLLLFFLPILPYGNILRAVLVVVLIWLYVAVCGASPSAVRAAIMFSVLQFATISKREYVGINTLAATAFVMLVFDTHLLFNISFQLSFLAVAAILCWALPLRRVLCIGVRIVDEVCLALVISLVSATITAPLVVHYFGVVSIVGIAITPIVLLFANVVVLASILALLIPLPLFVVVAEWAARMQNAIVRWASELSGGHLCFSLSEGEVWGVYAVFIALTLIFYAKSSKKVVQIEG